MIEITDVKRVPPTEVILRGDKNRRELKDVWLGDYYGTIDGVE